MAEGPQYTSCVEPKDFTKIANWYLAILGAAGIASLGLLFLSAGVALLLASAVIVEALHYVLNWLLNGKLICLRRPTDHHCNCGDNGGQVCAIGECGDFEEVGEDKNPLDDVDNDYALNMVLAPASHVAFADNKENSTEFVNDYTEDTISAAANKNLALAQSGPQGDLIQEQPGMPEKDLVSRTKFVGYFRTFVMLTTTKEYHPWNELFGRNFKNPGGPDYAKLWSDYLLAHAWQLPVIYSVPTLHCEFEGSRIRDTLAAIDQFTFGGKWCKKNIFFKILCKIIQTIPLALAAAIKAWADATGGSANDALQDPEAGELKIGQMIIVRGRWAYDGGHDGYNEIHAVRRLQRVGYVPQDLAEFKNFQDRWCARLAEVPPGSVTGGLTAAPMTPEQQAVDDNQRRPENQWEQHPVIDGCDPGGHRGALTFKPIFPIDVA